MPSLVYKTNLVFQRKHTGQKQVTERMYTHPQLLLKNGSWGGCLILSWCYRQHWQLLFWQYLCQCMGIPTGVVSHLYIVLEGKKIRHLHFPSCCSALLLVFTRLLWQLLSFNTSDTNFLSCCQLWPELWLDSESQDRETYSHKKE